MEKCKTKITQEKLGIFIHIPAYSRILKQIPAYSGMISHIEELFRHVQNPV